MTQSALQTLSFLSQNGLAANAAGAATTRLESNANPFSSMLQARVQTRGSENARSDGGAALRDNQARSSESGALSPATREPSRDSSASARSEQRNNTANAPQNRNTTNDSTARDHSASSTDRTRPQSDTDAPADAADDSTNATATPVDGDAAAAPPATATAEAAATAVPVIEASSLPASLAAALPAVAEQLAKQAGQLVEVEGDADIPAAASDSDEALAAVTLLGQGAKKGKATTATDPAVDGKFGVDDKTPKTLTSQHDAAANALRSQALNNRVLSFANIPTSPAASTSALQADLPTGTLQAAGFNPGLRTEQSTVPQLQVHTPAGQRVWAEDVGSKLIWLAGKHETKAELQLTPPSLGKLGISIHTQGDQTTAHFVAATPAAREALEQAMPRLREMLQQAGINLGQADVSTASEQQARQQGDGSSSSGGNRWQGGGQDDGDALALPSASNRWSAAGNGLVDIFA